MSPTAETLTYTSHHHRASGQGNSRCVPHKSLGRPTSSQHRHVYRHDSYRMRNKMSNRTVQIPNGGLEDDEDLEDKKLRFQFFHKEPCLYSHEIYIKAAKVFTALKHDSKEEKENPLLKRKNREALKNKVLQIPELHFQDDSQKRLSFELAFKTLKYQMLFEEILDDTSFFSLFPEHVEDMGLVMVTLCDFQGRKFQLRTPFPGEELDPVCQQVETAIVECKTKLNACLARHRIKKEAPSVEHLLPDLVRSKEEIQSKMPMYIWVNQSKISISEAVELFKEEGYTLVDSEQTVEDVKFHVDSMCNDVLMFAPEQRAELQDHYLVLAGKVILQDLSSSIAPHSVKYLIGDENDVIHVNVGSGMTTAHIASLMQGGTGHVWAFGPRSQSEVQQVQQNIERLGIKGVKVQSESFLNVEPDDSRFKNSRVILITADCSKSGIANPIDFIVNEGEDMKILKDLSVGDTDVTKLGILAGQHGELLKHAMKFSKVQAIVYMTRSIHEAENENVVSKSVEYINMVQRRHFPYRVVPPVLPFTGEAIENNYGIHGKFVKFLPTDRTSGCFIAVITREPEDSKEAAKDVLARAQAKGLLSSKKQKEPKTLNGDVSETVLNGHVDVDSKLLRKRSRKLPRRIPGRGAASAPQVNQPAYTKPHATSPIHTYITSSTKSHTSTHQTTRSAVSIGTRLFNSATKTQSASDRDLNKSKRLHMSEHMKVVKHPAPFSRKKRSSKDNSSREGIWSEV